MSKWAFDQRFSWRYLSAWFGYVWMTNWPFSIFGWSKPLVWWSLPLAGTYAYWDDPAARWHRNYNFWPHDPWEWPPCDSAKEPQP